MSTFNHGYKFRIYPTEEQVEQLDTFIHLYRAVYNWGIGIEKKAYEEFLSGKCSKKESYHNFMSLCYMFQEERKNNKWFQNIPLATAKLALRNVDNNFKRFFDKVTIHPPGFKSKKRTNHSFNTRHNRFSIKNDSIKIEGIPTRISLGFDSGFNLYGATNPTISKNNLGEYFISFNIEEETKCLDTPKSEGIGIDLGKRRTLVLSTGEMYTQPNEKLDYLERKRRKIERHVSRDMRRRYEESIRTKTKYEDIPKSKRAIKRENRLKKYYKKIHNIKDTFYHTITKRIVETNPEYICMETFSITRMGKSKKIMHKILHNTSFYDITQKMKEKCEEYNIPFYQAPVEFASTKTCSNCGSIKKIDGKHTYKCPVCGMVEDRDINAAINLKQYGLDLLYSNIGKID